MVTHYVTAGFPVQQYLVSSMRRGGPLRGVSNGLCEHASSAFIFASTSSDQFYHASSEHFVIFSPAGVSLY